MPVQKDPSGRRFVEAEAEVPGTPEEVWDAIASGPGISSWFVPTNVEQHEGGAITADFGPGMESKSVITSWNPPNYFAADSRDDMAPGDPTVATEWFVEAKAGGTCVVRVVHSWFTDSDKWDNQYEGTVHGWNSFFRILRLYLAHFSGKHGSVLQLMGMAPEPKETAWAKLKEQLGLEGVTPGTEFATTGSSPRLAGVVEHIGPAEYPEELLLRLNEPTIGLVHMFAMPMAGQIFLPMRIFLYGDEARAIAERDEPAWQAWMQEQFAPAQL